MLGKYAPGYNRIFLLCVVTCSALGVTSPAGVTGCLVVQRWCGQCWSSVVVRLEEIIGFSPQKLYADAIEAERGVKVRVTLGPIQMRRGGYTRRQMSEPIASYSLTGGNLCVCLCSSENSQLFIISRNTKRNLNAHDQAQTLTYPCTVHVHINTETTYNQSNSDFDN